VSDLPGALRAFDPLAAAGADGEPGALRLDYVLLDVFSETPLAGNQLAVFSDARPLDGAQMQRLARELQLSETVFVLPGGEGADARIRIFTPAAELPFAGHPVLGTAVLVAAALGRDRVTLETGMGPVGAAVRTDAGGVLHGTVEQPIPSWSAFAEERPLLGALGVERAQLPVECYENGPRHVLVALERADQVAALRPDLAALAALGEVCVSCFAPAGEHWKTRMFAPALGVPEDAATGSAAGPLALHLARHGRIPFGRPIEIEQGAEIGRPSLLEACARGEGQSVTAVEVGGFVVAVARGEFALSRGDFAVSAEAVAGADL
jgi:trans-2,3-dihydro-3-hydroxyanthranilate isomerase